MKPNSEMISLSRRRVKLFWFTGLLIVTAGARCYSQDDMPDFDQLVLTNYRLRPLRISSDTTYVSEPLTADGRVDYVSWIEQQRDPIEPRKNLASLLFDLVDRQTFAPEGIQKYRASELISEEPETAVRFVEAPAWHADEEFETNRLRASTRYWPSDDAFPRINDWIEANQAALNLIDAEISHREFCAPHISYAFELLPVFVARVMALAGVD